ncbi:diguanylate cyclase [Luteimonas fraxinea]|uniref:diguanylate cyclase n=1 Tax=Luteimonas fraxinea TaxID=2901869 RepID=A0ABS8U9T9_9GAMM|nr:ligand-binding sensor domain-containing diguanylate cyclase [Luteimonas fraxinea]MCD9095335.1 diguanylate cyclase [Luteimonas fraxinea]UHH11450.1 diguanylate cyclase [Luteimonas fraxinea]
MRKKAVASARCACQPVHVDACSVGAVGRVRSIATQLLAATLLACASFTVSAQVPDPVDDPPLSLEMYGLDEGLSQLTVSAMTGDDQGFLWVATQDGLNRFDGHRFRAYRNAPDQPVGGANLVSSSIDSLAFEPQRTRMWLGTNDAGLEVVHLPTWTQRRLGVADGLSHARVVRILLDPAGGAWLGTEAGVDHIDAEIRGARRLGATGEIVGLAWSAARKRPVALDAACGLWSVEADGLVRLPALPGARRCVSLQAGREGLWVLAADAGLFRLDTAARLQRHWSLAVLGVASVDATAMIRLEDGRVLTGYGNGAVVQLAPGRDRPRRLRFDNPPRSAITSFHQGATGAWWIGTYTSGLYRVRPLASVIRHDGAGVGTMDDWDSHSIRAIRRDGARMLIGTDSGLRMRDGPRAGWCAIPGLADLSVRAIERARDGGWWVGTQVGLRRLHVDGRVDIFDGLPDARIDALLAEDEALWIGTRSGVMQLRDGRIEADPRFAAIAGDVVTVLYRDQDGSLWVGTNTRGLWRLRDGVFAQVEPSGAGMHRSVWAIHGDADAIWVGAFAAGLYRIDRATGVSSVLTERDGLTNNVIYRILPDIGGRLWLSTNLGLSVYDPESGIVQNLGRRDGLRNQEYNSGSAYTGSDGLLYFGGTMGVDVIAPMQLPRRSASAHPVLTSLQLLSRQSDTDARSGTETDIVYTPGIDLRDEDSVFTIGMTAIDFLAPAAAQLRYRVDGLHTGWIYPHQARTEFSLNHLPAGHYRLEVQAAGRDGQFGESRVLTIAMPPPPWRHPLAYVLYALLAALAVAFFVRRTRRAVQRERERVELLNRTVAERTAQLEQANRQLQQSNAQLDAATRLDPLTQVPNRRELQEWLAREAVHAPGRRGSDTLFFFMLDIDAFKRINDGHGHQAGDEALVQFAARMRALTRDGDLLLRWGGEEFMLVARLDDADAAAGLAERIRSTVADTPIALAHGASLRMTCSIGFAPWPFSSAWPTLGDWQQTTAIADRCLYAAKDGGRDAWVGLVPGLDADRPRLQALLSGADPVTLGNAVRLLHSTVTPPRFER